MEMAKVTSKGQITIPVSIRRRLKINEGDKLLFIDQPGGVMMVNPDLLGTSQEYEVEVSALETTANTVPPPAAKVATEKKADKPPAPEPLEDDSAAQVKPAKSTPIETPEPSPDRPARKTGATVGNLDLDSLLDEIRSIGRKI